MQTPTVEQMECAAEWLDVNEGEDGEAEGCHAVATWLRAEAKKKLKREAMAQAKRQFAAEKGISVAHLERCRKGIDPWPR